MGCSSAGLPGLMTYQCVSDPSTGAHRQAGFGVWFLLKVRCPPPSLGSARISGEAALRASYWIKSPDRAVFQTSGHSSSLRLIFIECLPWSVLWSSWLPCAGHLLCAQALGSSLYTLSSPLVFTPAKRKQSLGEVRSLLAVSQLGNDADRLEFSESWALACHSM